MCSTRASGCACRRVIWSGLSAASNSRRRPSQLRKVPDFSAAADTGSTTSASSVTAPGRSSRLTRKPTASSACRARTGSGRSSTPTPPTTSADSSPSAAASTICAVSRPGSAGSSATPQARATSARASSLPTGRAPGSSPGRQPASTAPRSPARRGTHTSVALLVAAAVRTAAVSAPGTVASRSPTRITEPSPRSASAAAAPCSSSPTPPASASSHSVSVPGRGGQQGAARLLQSAGGVARQREGALPVLAPGFAQPQEDAGRLLLRLESGQQQRGRGLQRRVADPGAVQITAAARHLGGEERRFLGRVRPGAEVDVVGAQRHPGELRVRVGVLDGDPAAGQHPGPAARPGKTAGRGRQRLRPARGGQFAVGAADQRGVQPVGALRVAEPEAALVAQPATPR